MTITFSKATKTAIFFDSEILRVKIKPSTSSKNQSTDDGATYIAEFFSKTQAFHKKMTESEVEEFFKTNAGTTFKNAVKRTETEEITILSNKKGKVTELRRRIENATSNVGAPSNNAKNYILKEGSPIPFLVQLGIMTDEGKVIKSKYDKFRQINRFLEFIDDVVPEIKRGCSSDGRGSSGAPIKIIDFGCGKSYLTFAIHYFFTEILKIETEIIGLDLKKDVIEYCQRLAKKIGAKNLTFQVGDIKEYGSDSNGGCDSSRARPNLVVTLHACDTATDAALDFAVAQNADVILSVPCCQHELNAKITKARGSLSGGNRTSPLEPILKYGILRERFSALATDAFRCEFLEEHGYKTQILEFIDIEHTPKNLLIRAVRRNSVVQDSELTDSATAKKAQAEAKSLYNLLGAGIYGRNYD